MASVLKVVGSGRNGASSRREQERWAEAHAWARDVLGLPSDPRDIADQHESLQVSQPSPASQTSVGTRGQDTSARRETGKLDDPSAIDELIAGTDASIAHISAMIAQLPVRHGRLPVPAYNDVYRAETYRGSGDQRFLLDDGPAQAQAPSAYERATASGQLDPVGTVRADAGMLPTRKTRRDEESPIAGATKSSWLSSDEHDHTWTSTEVEAGWQRADTVAETHNELTSDAGLPIRRPGARLVPGGVSKPVGAGARDPEAIRARLSAHKEGVRRSRTSTVFADDQ